MTRDQAARSRAIHLVEGSSAGGARVAAVAQRAPAILLDRIRRLIATEALLYAELDVDPLVPTPAGAAGNGAASASSAAAGDRAAAAGGEGKDPLDGLARTLRRHGGRTLERHPDHLVACFEDVRDAFTTAVEASQPRLRLAVHAYCPSDAELGPPAAALAEVASVGRAGQGGQVLVSAGAQQAVGDMVPRGATLGEIGRWIARSPDEPRPVFGLAHPRLETGFPPLAPGRHPRHQLPRHVAAPLGRDDELASLTRLVQSGRLVTLTGPAGVGKTRLAVEVAARLGAAFPGGVRFCDAAGAAEVGDVLGHLTSDLRREVTEPLDERVLLVLDGCDQLGPEVRSLIAGVRRPGGLGAVLATSSAALGMADEMVVPVRPLDAPDGVRLLARLVRGDSLSLDDEVSLDVDDTRLDTARLDAVARLAGGVPLALELAAPLVSDLGPGEVAGRLEAALAAQPVLAPRADGALDATLEVTLAERGLDGLGADHVRLLGGLSVFAGGWDVAGAQAVAPAVDVDPDGVAPLLATLARRALIRLDGGSGGTSRGGGIGGGDGGPARYRLPAGVRAHTARRLDRSGRRTAAADAHARFVLDRLRAATDPRRTRFEAAWARAIDADFDDVRVARHWFAAQRQTGASLELVWSLADDVLLRGRHEVGRWAEAAATSPDAAGHRLQTAALALASNAAFVEGRLERAEQLAEAAMAAGDDDGRASGGDGSSEVPGRWIALNTLALLAAAAGDEQTCGRRLFEVLATAQADGDRFAITTAMYEAVLLYWNAGRPAEGRPLAKLLRGVDPAEASPSMLAMAALADGLTDTGENPERARRLLERGMDLASSALGSLLFLHGWRAVHRLVMSSRDRIEAVRQLHAVAEEFRVRGNVNDQMQTVIDLLWHLIELGADRPAAVICGYLSQTPFQAIDRFQRAERRVRDTWDRRPAAASDLSGLSGVSDPASGDEPAGRSGRDAWDNGAAMSPQALATFIGQTVDRLAAVR